MFDSTRAATDAGAVSAIDPARPDTREHVVTGEVTGEIRRIPRPESSTPAHDERTGARGLWALFAGLGLMMMGNGLNGAVIGVRSGTEGFSVAVTGFIMAGYFAGFLVGPSAVVKLVPRVGHVRVFAALASVASSAVLIHAVAVNPVAWIAMRLVFGFCMAGLYVVIESWLTEMSTVANRGRTLAVYMIVTMLGLGAGQLLLATADPDGFTLFIVASVLVSLSLVPITLTHTTRTPPGRPQGFSSVMTLVREVPTGVVGSLMSGATAGILLGLGAVYASRAHFTVNVTALFLAAPTIGAILFQWPIGRLSDRISRRTVIFGVAIGGAALSTLLALMSPGNDYVPFVMLALGGMMFPLYSLVVSYTLDWTPPENMVAASGTLVRINGTGAVVGPVVAALLMSKLDLSVFFWSMATTQSVIVAYVGWRMLFKDAMPMDDQRAFVPFPARATDFAIKLALTPIKVPRALKRTITSRQHHRIQGNWDD